MAVDSITAYREAFVDFTPLETRLGVRMADVDCYTERNGCFLYVEFKAEGKRMPDGQRIAFERRVQDGRSEVAAVWLTSDGVPSYYQLYARRTFGPITGGWDELTGHLRTVLDRFSTYPPIAQPQVYSN